VNAANPDSVNEFGYLGEPDLGDWLVREGERVDAALERALAALEGEAKRSGSPLAESHLDAVRHGLLSGGKRLRPVLCVAAWSACVRTEGSATAGGPAPHVVRPTPDAIYDVAASLEMIHAYSLMHDDLPCMDDAALRRGRPTTHRVHGETTTMHAGAALIPAAALQALAGCRSLGCDDATGRAVATELMEAAGAGGMVGGQWVDLLGEGMALGANELDALHRMKTGALLTASLVMGALAAGAGPVRTEALRAYGRAIGLAFQIADDVLDATADAETLGKNPSDADLDKSTYVALYGLEEARERAAAQVDEAIEALHSADLHVPALEAIARYIVEREK
jgi:geranylgeranyl pyrophosphate synthase